MEGVYILKYLKTYESFDSTSIIDRYSTSQILEMFQELEDDFEFVINNTMLDTIVLEFKPTNESLIRDMFSDKKYKITQVGDSVKNNLYVYTNENAYLLQLYSTDIDVDKKIFDIKKILDTKSESYNIKYIFSNITEVNNAMSLSEYKLILY